MTSAENETQDIIKAWCEDQCFSEKVMALLSVWNPDIEELSEWDINENINENYIDVNGDRYRVFSLEEMNNEIQAYQENTQHEIEAELSEQFSFIVPFIDWGEFWYANYIHPEEVVYGVEEVIYNDEPYYYVEWSNL